MRKNFFSDLSCTHGRTYVYGRYAPVCENKRRQIFKKPHQELGMCHCSYTRYSEMCFYKFGDAMLAFLHGANNSNFCL